jgi:hypothetical protein
MTTVTQLGFRDPVLHSFVSPGLLLSKKTIQSQKNGVVAIR